MSSFRSQRSDDPASGSAPGGASLLRALLLGNSLERSVPEALALVEGDPLASAGCFRGDVVRGLMEVPGSFWGAHPELYERYRAALRASAARRRALPGVARMEFWSMLSIELIARNAEGKQTPP